MTPSERVGVQLFRYLFVGGVAFLLDAGPLVARTELFGVHSLVSGAVGFGVGLVVNYVLSTRWVFAHRTLANRRVEFLVFAAIGVVGLGLNEMLLFVGTENMGLDYRVSKLLAVVTGLGWNFTARRVLLFRNR